MKKIIGVIACGLFLNAAAASSQVTDKEKVQMEKRIEKLIKKMTLEEKVGLLHGNSKFYVAGVERPEIPDLEHQKKYFHGGKGEKGVVIEDNYFETFDRPVLFAKSIDGLVFKNNVIRQNTDYPAFHHNKTRFRLLHTRNVKIEKNNFEDGDESVVRE